MAHPLALRRGPPGDEGHHAKPGSAPQELGCELDHQPCLARAADPDQSHQSMRVRQRRELRELTLAADEGGQLGRNIGLLHPDRPKFRELGWEARADELMIAYHDQEWGDPVRDDHKLFEMLILEGAVEMTIEDETKTLGPGDVVVVNRGLHHKLYSEGGVTFMEALAPVPLDHVPDKQLDLVLGPEGGATHVEK